MSCLWSLHIYVLLMPRAVNHLPGRTLAEFCRSRGSPPEKEGRSPCCCKAWKRAPPPPQRAEREDCRIRRLCMDRKARTCAEALHHGLCRPGTYFGKFKGALQPRANNTADRGTSQPC